MEDKTFTLKVDLSLEELKFFYTIFSNPIVISMLSGSGYTDTFKKVADAIAPLLPMDCKDGIDLNLEFAQESIGSNKVKLNDALVLLNDLSVIMNEDIDRLNNQLYNVIDEMATATIPEPKKQVRIILKGELENDIKRLGYLPGSEITGTLTSNISGAVEWVHTPPYPQYPETCVVYPDNYDFIQS